MVLRSSQYARDLSEFNLKLAVLETNVCKFSRNLADRELLKELFQPIHTSELENNIQLHNTFEAHLI